MRKGLFGICSVLLVLIVSLALLVPSCTQTPTTGTIVVKATLCGNAWPGAVNYTLTPTGGSPVSGTAVPTTHSSMNASTWTCAYVAGGPAGAFLNSIKPSTSQSLVAGGTITFTLDFELNQDAWIVLADPTPWTLNGTPVSGTEGAVLCNIIDAHFKQGVNGCNGYNVTLNETSWLRITQTAGPPGVVIYVVNAMCAVNKTANAVKVFQVPSINNATAQVSQNITLNPGMPTTLDVETQWGLVKNITYMKNINWFGISLAPFVPPGPHTCVLFELVLPVPPIGQYTFTLQTSAQVALVGGSDVNHGNDNSGWSNNLTLIM